MSTSNVTTDELESLREIARLARNIFEPSENDWDSILLNALLCTKEDVDELAWSLEQERMNDTGTRTTSPYVAYQRITKRIDLAIALDEHRERFGKSDDDAEVAL